MTDSLGISKQGLNLALSLKEKYRTHQPLCVPGDDSRLLMPEHLLNVQIDLEDFEDPLPLAVVAARDPDSPMAVAATVRMSPLARQRELVHGVFTVLGETTKHSVVRQCVEMVTEGEFNANVIAEVRAKASRFVIRSRQQYTAALRQNLRALIDGAIEPRAFVNEFFELTEAGNLRLEIRKRLVLSLMKSESVRPSIKFLFLENFDRLPDAVRTSLITDIKRLPPSKPVEFILDELKWMERPIVANTMH